MPMDFPDLESLKRTAEMGKFREIGENESEDSYRAALADHFLPIDAVMSHEIRTGVGWDKWTTGQKKNHLGRLGFNF